MSASVTLLDMAAECRRPAEFNRAHGMTLRGGKRRAVPVTVGFAVATENIRHFRVVASQVAAAQAGAGTPSAVSRAAGWRMSSGLAVAHTLLVARRRYLAVVFRLR